MRGVISFLLIVNLSISNAQGDTSFYQYVKELETIFDQTNYTPVEFRDTSLHVIKAISTRQRNGTVVNRSTYLEKQKELAERDYGVEVTGNYLENINPTIGDLEDNLIYSRKFTAGVEWNILDNGYLESRVEARILEDKIIRNQMITSANTENFNFLERFDYTIFLFNEVKINLLYKRKEQLQKQYDVINNLVLLKKLKKEELINLDTRLSEVESLINVYKSYNDYLGITKDSVSFNFDNLPLIDLNYEKIFSMLGIQTDSLLSGNIYQDYYSWYHEVRLSAFFRYNYYDLIGDNYRNFFTAGVNFSVPIPFNYKLQNEIEAEKWKYENEKMVDSRISLHEDILNMGYEFRYKYKQFISFYQKRRLFMERLRVEKVKVRLGDVNVDPLGGLDLYDDLLQIDIELVDLLQNMYLKAVRIHSKIPHSDISDLITLESTETMSEYIDDKSRSVYVWSKTFSEFSPVFMTEYCIYNEFKNVVIAVHENDSLKKSKIEFMNYTAANGEVHFMIGDNKLIYDENPQNRLEKILSEYDNFKPKGIHLDVEPHTFDEWGTEKQRLLNLYLKMVGKISTWCKQKDIKLAVSIPPTYGADVVDNLIPLVDEIYFMCYENVKTEYLVNKLITYVDDAKDKMVIALRTEDFINRIEMENKIKELESQTGIKKFAYHDLRRMILFDRKSIE